MTDPQKSMIESAVANLKARRSVYRYRQEARAKAEREEADALRDFQASTEQYRAICDTLVSEAS